MQDWDIFTPFYFKNLFSCLDYEKYSNNDESEKYNTTNINKIGTSYMKDSKSHFPCVPKSCSRPVGYNKLVVYVVLAANAHCMWIMLSIQVRREQPKKENIGPCEKNIGPCERYIVHHFRSLVKNGTMSGAEIRP